VGTRALKGDHLVRVKHDCSPSPSPLQDLVAVRAGDVAEGCSSMLVDPVPSPSQRRVPGALIPWLEASSNFQFGVFLTHKDQHAEQRHVEAECRFLAVPKL
jgi:hypothetical protein